MEVNDIRIDVASISVHTLFGKTQITTIYAHPGRDIPPIEWSTIFDLLPKQTNLIFCGDFNSHHTSWGDISTNLRGSSLETFTMDSELFVTNDSIPTRFRDANVTGSNLDLIFCSSTILQSSLTNVIQDHFNSDHLPVIFKADISPDHVLPPSNRFCLKCINWLAYRESIDQYSLDLTNQLSTGISPAEIYTSFIDHLKQSLIKAGAFIPKTKSMRC